MNNKFLVLLSCLLVNSILTFGQTSENRLMAGLSSVFMDYDGPLTGEYTNTGNFSPGLGFGAHIYLAQPLNLSVNTAFVPEIRYPNGNGSFSNPSLIDVNTLLQFKLNNGKILKESAFFAPYFSTGFGLNSVSNTNAFYLPVALGFRMKITRSLSINLESMYKQSLGRNYQHLAHSAGLVFNVPSNKKKDEPVKKEQNISKPLASRKAVNLPEKNRDSDGDGIADSEDTCPDVMGLVQFGGCPPKISDPADNMMGITSVSESSLNYDSSDSFLDNDMPTSSSKNVEVGRTSQVTEINIEKEDSEFLEFAMNGIFFEVNSDNLKQESLPVLDKVAEILTKYPAASLAVEGHSDVTGDNNSNLVLSIKRAFRVKYYLVHEKGVKLSRIESNGYGASSPIADNGTAEGRKQNRRVEFELKPSIQ